MADALYNILSWLFYEATDVNKRKAEEIKEQANVLFKNKDYQRAIQLYTIAIMLNPRVAAYHGNYSIACLRVERFQEALTIATIAVFLDKSYTKAWYTRGCANMALGNIMEAANDFEMVMDQQPKSVEACTKFHECLVLLIRRKKRSPKSTGESENLLEKAKTDGAPKTNDLKPQGCIPQYEIIPEGGNPADSWTRCQDGHLHDKFITMDDLMTLKCLPPALRNQKTKDALQEYSDRTVRVQVNKCSPNRPDFFLGSDVNFPFHKHRGEKTELYGTGFVFPGKLHENQNCPCKKCQRSGKPERTYQILYVMTASHVIYDDKEAEESEFLLYYDKPRLHQCGAKKFYGLKLVDGDEYIDDDAVGGDEVGTGHVRAVDGVCVETMPDMDQHKLLGGASNNSTMQYKVYTNPNPNPFGKCKVIVDDFHSFLQKVRDIKIGIPAGAGAIVGDEPRESDSESRSANDALLRSREISKSMCVAYLQAIEQGNAVLASCILLSRLEDMKCQDKKQENDKVNTNKSASVSSSNSGDPNRMFHSRRNTFDAITKTASFIDTNFKDGFGNLATWANQTIKNCDLIKQDFETRLMDNSLHNEMEAIFQKLLNTFLLLTKCNSALSGMSIGDIGEMVDVLNKVLIGRFDWKVEGDGGIVDDEDGQNGDIISVRNDLSKIHASFSKDFDAYITGTVLIFLNILIPIFWEEGENFSGFGSDETDILKVLNGQHIRWRILFSRCVEDVRKLLPQQNPAGRSFIHKMPNENELYRTLFFACRAAKLVPPVDASSSSSSSSSSGSCGSCGSISGGSCGTGVHQDSRDTKFRKYTSEQVVVKCVTHKPSVIDRFRKMDLMPPKVPLTFIISHPHGYYKRIAFGTLTQTMSSIDHSYFVFMLKKQRAKYRLSSRIIGGSSGGDGGDGDGGGGDGDGEDGDGGHDGDGGVVNGENGDRTTFPVHAMTPGKEYLLEQDLRLGVPMHVFEELSLLISRSSQNSNNDLFFKQNSSSYCDSNVTVTWFAFPPGSASILNYSEKDEGGGRRRHNHQPKPLPEGLEFDVVYDADPSRCLESVMYTPVFFTHDIQTCGGSSGALIHDYRNKEEGYLLTHCGTHYDDKKKKKEEKSSGTTTTSGRTGYSSLSLPVGNIGRKGKLKLKEVLKVRPAVFVSGRHVPIFPGPKA